MQYVSQIEVIKQGPSQVDRNTFINNQPKINLNKSLSAKKAVY